MISHGNGPQVGLLALQGAAYKPDEAYPLDVLGAETEGMIGYMIEQELGNLLPFEVPFATLLTMVEVDPDDPGFKNPTKFVGPVYEKADADRIAGEKGWVVKQDGAKWRRVVPSPEPKRIFELRPIKWLLEKGAIVIAAGGGGIPTMYQPGADRKLVGVEAVIDKDFCSELLAREVEADLFVMATDADAVFDGWGTPDAKAIHRASPGRHRRLPVPGGLDGAEGGRGLPVRPRHRQDGGDRLARRPAGDRARREGDAHRRGLRGGRVPSGLGPGSVTSGREALAVRPVAASGGLAPEAGGTWHG